LILSKQVGEYRRTIADVVYDKMIECLGVPRIVPDHHEHKAENFFFDADYLSLYRSENCIVIQLIFSTLRALNRRPVLQSRCGSVAREATGAAEASSSTS